VVAVIRDARALPAAQVRFKDRHIRLMKDAAATIAGVLLRDTGVDGRVIASRAEEVVRQAGEVVQSVFVIDGRRSLGADGVPLSPYAQALFSEIYLVTRQVVNRHADYMDKQLDPETRALMLRSTRRISEQQGPGRLFEPNPLAVYEPAHTWVDPRGYVLSQRIWRTSLETRRKLDEMMSDLISQGKSSQEIARQVEQFLVPGRAAIRTNPYAPYGTDASYDAMRLARTEIARAHNQAAWVSAYLNPYVDQVRVLRSNNGDPECKICLRHAGPVGGEGIVYLVTDGNIPPFHPHCMCYLVSEVNRSPDEVTAEIRAMLEDAERELVAAMISPVQRDVFIEMLLGAAIAQFLQQLLPMQLELGLGF